jgi:glucose/mannose transport system substrate-binding protein
MEHDEATTVATTAYDVDAGPVSLSSPDTSAFATADPARVRGLLVDYLGGITRYLARLGVPQGEVDDVAQEVFLVAASKLGGVPVESERAFLYAIASRVAHNARRANVRRKRAYDRFVDVGVEPHPSQEELTDHLRARVLVDSVLREMTPELRGIFLLCEVEGLAVPEIARRLSLPIGTAASRLRRAREAFSERIARESSRGSGRARGAFGRSEGPEILSWWVSDGEVDALRALIDIYRRSHPGAAVVHGGIRDTTNAKVRLNARMAGGAPPDTFQANGGHDLLQWARGDAESGGGLEPLEFLFQGERWRDVFPADLLDLVTTGGEAYAVPLNVHRTNTMLYDVRAFEAAGIAPPRTLDELHAAAARLRRQRPGVAPLSIGTRQPWMLSLLAFENLLVALAGPAFYRALFEGKMSPRSPEIRATIEELGRLLDAANGDADRLAWDEAADRVRIGRAAMTIGGDWAKGYLERRGCIEGDDFILTATPGTSSAFVFTMDTFGLPRGAPHREGAIELLKVFGSPHGQSVFNRIKGSRPARNDVSEATFASAETAFDEATRVPTLTSLVPPSFSSAMDAALGAFARRRDVDEVLGVFERSYGALAG